MRRAMTLRNNHVFKGHKTLLGSKYVTYGEVELPLRYDLFSQSKDGFDWGYNGSGPLQLAFSMLYQLSDKEFSRAYASKFANEVIKTFPSRDWVMSGSEVLEWIKQQQPEKRGLQQEVQAQQNSLTVKKTQQRKKSNIVKKICNELSITQKQLAQILEVPEGTVSSWAVKDEIPRLGKKAIEFYIQNKKNQEIVNTYKQFVTLLNKV